MSNDLLRIVKSYETPEALLLRPHPLRVGVQVLCLFTEMSSDLASSCRLTFVSGVAFP